MKSTIKLNEAEYPLQIEGQGSVPCLCIGIGSLMMRTLSADFKKMFTLYSSDLYFSLAHKHTHPSSVSMATLVNDIIEVIKQLNLSQPIIIAHSCFGIVALEVAKVMGEDIKGVILVASAPQWNADSMAKTNAYFNTHAEPQRIQNDNERKAKYLLIKKPTDSEVSVERYIADSARYWENFNISEQEIHQLWQDIYIDDAVVNQFFEVILPSHNLALNMNKVVCPVILLAGEKDFDSIPLVQWENYAHPQHFTIVNCGNAGHWPQLEARTLFDDSIKKWLFA